MPPKEKLYDRLYRAVGMDRNNMNVKLVEPPKVVNKSSFKVFSDNAVVQADLIYMPEDNGYNFILTVVDVASRAVDAEPLENRTAEDVVQGFEQIFKRKFIKPTFEYLYTDPGAEFKNEMFHDYMKSHEIVVRHTMTGRKTQMAIVEYYNHILTKVLGTRMTAKELENNTVNKDWVESLPKLITELNKDKKEQKIGDFFKYQIFQKNEKLLNVGDYVHVKLVQPKETLTGKKLHGTFRNGDQRFNKEVQRISYVSLKPGQPPRYMIEGMNNVSFLRGELLLADENEITAENAKRDDEENKRKKEKEDEEDKQKNTKCLNVMSLRSRLVHMFH